MHTCKGSEKPIFFLFHLTGVFYCGRTLHPHQVLGQNGSTRQLNNRLFLPLFLFLHMLNMLRSHQHVRSLFTLVKAKQGPFQWKQVNLAMKQTRLSNHRPSLYIPVQRMALSSKNHGFLQRKEKEDGIQPTISESPKKELREDIYTIPNVLTFGRLLAAPAVGYLIMEHNYDEALGLFALAGFTDMLDGHIARKYNMKTVLGTMIDPLADKVLMTVMTVTLAMQSLLPVPLAVVILGRDAGLIASSCYYRYISLPEPKTIKRYFDGSIPSAEVKPSQISKINTALQLVLMGFSLSTVCMGLPSSPEFMTAFHWVVGGTTVWSGAGYMLKKNAVRIIKQ